MIKVYLDTCVLSGLKNSKIDLNQLKALEQLCDREDIEFVSSEKMLDEFLQTQNNRTRMELRILYKLIDKLPSKNITETTTAFLSPMQPAAVERKLPLYEKLENIFDSDDAEHIYYAIIGDCDYFLTLDNNTILSRIDDYKEELDVIDSNIAYVNPLSLFKRIDG